MCRLAAVAAQQPVGKISQCHDGDRPQQRKLVTESFNMFAKVWRQPVPESPGSGSPLVKICQMGIGCAGAFQYSGESTSIRMVVFPRDCRRLVS
jgi:hypothetical protein